ncbi:50S ribosomal protein L10 [Govanella unica]|uniref:Large ribosomal subunit protein uL10 n=1 Tax=Govanella unica TaxID=2975056 RepID=A0A9X3TWI9_9PROT|nr:50S ribosomal protein L10 [Govania unica]MDA5193046.1 50S ribosomal protein L10 [Govania unica]
MDRAQKQELISSLKDVFSSTGVVVIAHYSGLTVAEITNLRTKMREAGGSFKVAKNRLAKLALQGSHYESIADLLTGPTAIGYSDDPVAAPKVLANFAKANDKLIILGGGMGATALDAAGVKALAALPSLDELRSRLLATIQTPATRIAGVVQAPAGQLARVFGAYAKSEEAA